MENENFTLRYRKVMMSAQKVARINKRGYYTTLDILLSVLNESNCFAVKVLIRLGIDLDSLKKITTSKIYNEEFSNENPRYQSDYKNPVPTVEVEKIVQGSMKQAEKLGHMFIGTEHLLLSMVENASSASGDILQSLNINHPRLIKELEKLAKETDFSRKENERRKNGKHKEANEDDEEDKHSIEDFCRDLTGLAELGKLDPIIGRDREIERVIQVLARRRKNFASLLMDG